MPPERFGVSFIKKNVEHSQNEGMYKKCKNLLRKFKNLKLYFEPLGTPAL